jgi:hypothetical protein
MKKVNELDGAGLDYWVAKGEGLDKPTEQQQRDHLYLKIIGESCYLPSGGAYRPSSDWSQAGPIIDRGEVTDISPAKNGRSGWEATACGLSAKSTQAQYGRTALVAIMRAYVAGKFGDEVPDPQAGG